MIRNWSDYSEYRIQRSNFEFWDRLIIKVKYGLKYKSAAIELIAAQYEEEILEPELRPEFIEKMQNITKEEPIDVGTVYDLRARYGHRS